MFSSVHSIMQSGLRNTLLIVVVLSIVYMRLVLEKAYKSARTRAMFWDMKYEKGNCIEFCEIVWFRWQTSQLGVAKSTQDTLWHLLDLTRGWDDNFALWKSDEITAIQ